VKVRYHSDLSAVERDELAAWIDAHGSSSVDLVTVEEAAVVVYDAPNGPNRGAAGVAVRHGRRLTEALDEALADLEARTE
jgi:hypothetical protein